MPGKRRGRPPKSSYETAAPAIETPEPTGARASIELDEATVKSIVVRDRLSSRLASMGIELDDVHELEWQGSRLNVKTFGGPLQTSEK